MGQFVCRKLWAKKQPCFQGFSPAGGWGGKNGKNPGNEFGQERISSHLDLIMRQKGQRLYPYICKETTLVTKIIPRGRLHGVEISLLSETYESFTGKGITCWARGSHVLVLARYPS